MDTKAPRDGGSHKRGFFQGLFQFFTSVTGMVTAFVGLLAAVIGLAATQQAGTERSSSPSSAPPSSVQQPGGEIPEPPREKTRDSLNQSVSLAAPNSYLDLVEATIAPQLQERVQAGVPSAVVAVDSVDCTPGGDGGVCDAALSDSLGNTTTMRIAFRVINQGTGQFVWWPIG